MAELMAKMSTNTQFVTPKKGELLKGIITKLSNSGIVVDIKAKSDAQVMEKDPKIMRLLLGNLKEGQEVTVSVLNPESDTGNPVVSLRRFIDDILWKELGNSQKSGQKLAATIKDTTRGGFLVDTALGFSGFLPNSQITFPLPSGAEALQEVVGKRIDVYILEQNRATRKVIFSQKPILDIKAFEEAVKDLKVGDKVQGTVNNVASFGIFVTVAQKPNIDALVHISEISWDNVDNVASMFTVGQEIEAVVAGFDKDSKRIELSIKRLTEDPFKKLTDSLSVDQKVSGEVTGIDENGVAVSLDVEGQEVHGLIRKEKIPVGTTYEVGQSINATIAQIDSRRHKVYLVPVVLRKTIGYR